MPARGAVAPRPSVVSRDVAARDLRILLVGKSRVTDAGTTRLKDANPELAFEEVM